MVPNLGDGNIMAFVYVTGGETLVLLLVFSLGMGTLRNILSPHQEEKTERRDNKVQGLKGQQHLA